MSLRDWFRSALLPRRAAAPEVRAPAKRMYAAAQSSRLTSGWVAGTNSADVEIRSSLTTLRARSRQLCRDNPHAKRARVLTMNNVIGSGIGLQAQVKATRQGQLRKNVNDSIEDAFKRWSCAEYCHTGGTLSFSDLERALVSEMFEAGEVFVRMHMAPFGGSEIPFALELVESERVPHEFQTIATGDKARMGVEVDQYFRPLRYWIRDRHPSDLPGGMVTDNIRPVSAAEIIHLRLVERWPQTRGVPWLHAVAGTLNNMGGYTEAEIVAARASAQPIGWEEPSDFPNPEAEQQEDGTFETPYEPGFVHHGKKLNFYSPNRPNTALPQFISHLLKEVGIGVGYGVRYSSLSGDYSQANYSSERAAQLDDRDGWKALQQIFIRQFRHRVHPMWMQQAVFARQITGIGVDEYMTDRLKFEAAKFNARGWGWVDPTKEVEAYKEAEKAGYITKTQIIAQTSPNQDVEDVMVERKNELDMAAELDLAFDTDPEAYAPQPEAAPAAPAAEKPDDEEVDEPEETRMRVVK